MRWTLVVAACAQLASCAASEREQPSPTAYVEPPGEPLDTPPEGCEPNGEPFAQGTGARLGSVRAWFAYAYPDEARAVALAVRDRCGEANREGRTWTFRKGNRRWVAQVHRNLSRWSDEIPEDTRAVVTWTIVEEKPAPNCPPTSPLEGREPADRVVDVRPPPECWPRRDHSGERVDPEPAL